MAVLRPGAIRRLLADLRRSETRGDAIRRVRRRAGSMVRHIARGRTVTRATQPAPQAAGAAPARKPDSWYVAEWPRLATAVAGSNGTTDASATPAGPQPADAGDVLATANRQRAQAELAEALGRGDSLESAVCAAIRSLTANGDWRDLNAAWALAEGIGRTTGGAMASTLGHAILVHHRRQFDRVWPLLRDLPDEVLATHVAVEAVDAALADGSPEAKARALALSRRSEGMAAAVVVDICGRLLAFGERERAADLVQELGRRPSLGLDERRRHSLALIEGWLSRRPTSVPAGAVPFGVIDYRTPDHILASGNLGDYVQSLAVVGNLCRLTDASFTGEEGLGELATELKSRVRPDLRRPGAPGTKSAIHLIPIDREFSSASAPPPGTWMFAFGWHMHPLYDLRYDFPYDANIRPLFISFHVNRLDMLSDEARDYLRRHGPIGCRDWTTVFLLLSAGIDAFFSGCVSTTIDALFPRRDEVYGGKGAVGVIDLPAKTAAREATNVRTYSHQSDRYRYLPPADSLRAASDALVSYQRDLDRAVTGRLHAYLPLTALGVPVDFRPRSPGDIRFAGLAGMTPGDAQLEAMQTGIRDMTGQMLEAILAGASESDVYDRWRELTADRLADAKARFEAPVVDPPTTIDIAAAVAASRAGSRRFGPHDAVDSAAITDIVLCYDQNLTNPAAVLLESMVVNASGPLRAWILGRGLTPAYLDWLAGAFPDLPITFLPCDDVSYGANGRPARIPARITLSTMDRLLLPEMLDDVSRVVYTDVDVVMLGDICELARTALEGRPIAARDAAVSEPSEWQRAGRRLPAERALELRRSMAAAHGYGHPALNAGVLVLDLDRLRRDEFTRRYLGWVEEYGLNDQDAMLAYVGPERRTLDPSWNALPVLEDVREPRVIHWTSLSKPWEGQLTFGRERWLEHEASLRRRAGWPPTSILTDPINRPLGVSRQP